MVMEGIPTVTVDQVPATLPAGVVMLDVREPVEWEQAHVPGSVHIPLGELPSRLGELPGDTQLLVVCAVGARSARAVHYLVQHGHDAVTLEGGLMEWQVAGRELVAGSGG
jgi:rhodanese-related sulfurtransferase